MLWHETLKKKTSLEVVDFIKIIEIFSNALTVANNSYPF